jgi:hypothetical protein
MDSVGEQLAADSWIIGGLHRGGIATRKFEEESFPNYWSSGRRPHLLRG